MRPEYRMMPLEQRGGGLVRFVAQGEHYVMVRRKGCGPFVVSEKEWNSWPLKDEA